MEKSYAIRKSTTIRCVSTCRVFTGPLSTISASRFCPSISSTNHSRTAVLPNSGRLKSRLSHPKRSLEQGHSQSFLISPVSASYWPRIRTIGKLIKVVSACLILIILSSSSSRSRTLLLLTLRRVRVTLPGLVPPIIFGSKKPPKPTILPSMIGDPPQVWTFFGSISTVVATKRASPTCLRIS